MNLVSISEEAEGAVKKDDVIVKIGDDDLTGWTLMRGKQSYLGFLKYYLL
jgi:hypothetical protein